MLVQLSINNFALIDNLNLEFNNRLNVLTGETGAGKSIIIDAVSLLLGARAYNDVIRSTKDKALVEGVFLIPPNHPVEGILNQYGLDLAEDESNLILTREVTLNGKNTCRINNRMVTLAVFKEIGKQLINIYGQHDFQSLSEIESHIFLLDSLGNEEYQNLVNSVEESFLSFQSLQKQLDILLTKKSDKAQRLDFLNYQVDEIGSLKLSETEEEEINAELTILNNWEKIYSVVNEGYELLYGNNSAYDKVSKANSRIDEIVILDNKFSDIIHNLQTAAFYIEDAARAMRNYGDNFTYDNERKEYLRERKYAIDKLKRKYGGTIIDILEFKRNAENEIAQLVNSELLLEEVQNKVNEKKELFFSEAKKISIERQKIASQLELEMKKQLEELSMPNTIFKVEIKETLHNLRGNNKVEFLISPNPGEPLRPLSRIASGGEMSRIMLAFKVILAKSEKLTTLIFDEIDTGIGGEVVIKVAEKLFEVSKHYQVLCVTHSPHIASFAQQHFKIFKIIQNNKTFTQVEILEEKNRITELARMLGGSEKITISHASEMIKKAKQKF
ncbi:MAG: hypothetical protein VR72_05285 [Clostridiaceae bacterium BRH_c20a]|nr:MAG: hypothetical protein VR72_05285 [Clostridiaceae bacterium BRH_c20a]